VLLDEQRLGIKAGHSGAVFALGYFLRGILFDLPHVVAHGRSVFADNGVLDRQQTMGGSFFESVPAGGDIYLLKTVIHDWDDTRATAILASCRRAMTAGGKLNTSLTLRRPQKCSLGTRSTQFAQA
jgi:hypothetical protein